MHALAQALKRKDEEAEVISRMKEVQKLRGRGWDHFCIALKYLQRVYKFNLDMIIACNIHDKINS